MRKKLTRLLVLLLFVVYSMQTQIKVYANTVSARHIENTGYMHTGTAYSPDGGSAWFINQAIEKIHMSDGNIGFCIEPWNLIGNPNGYIPNIEQRIAFSKMIYHGYVNTPQSHYDYALTQLMIWESIQYCPSHTVVGYEQRKQEVLQLIAQHDTRVSFDNHNISLQQGESITLKDTNQVLHQFIVEDAQGMLVMRKGNDLVLQATEHTPLSGSITLRKYEQQHLGVSYVYDHFISQKIYAGKLSDPIQCKINFEVDPIEGQIEIFKTVDDTQNSNGVGYTFLIINEANEIVDKITTNQNGYAISKLLNAGQYQVVEQKSASFEVLKPFSVLINEDGKVYSFTLENKVEKYIMGQVDRLQLIRQLL